MGTLASVLFASPLAAAAECIVNGKNVPCSQVVGTFGKIAGFGLAAIIIGLVIFILVSIFWLIMLIHAIRKPIEHKPIWILLILITGFIGAVVYFFAVKRNFNDAAPQIPQQPTQPNQPTTNTT